MAVTRTRLSKGATEIFRGIERKTKYTPNLLARLALAMSMQSKEPLPSNPPDNGGQELNHTTLYGRHENIYRHMAIQWVGNPDVDIYKILRLHIERGAPLLQTAMATQGIYDLPMGMSPLNRGS